MHIVVLFVNAGSYHLARLRAAGQALGREGWRLTAVQSVDRMVQYPWGRIEEPLPVSVVTLTDTGASGPVDAMRGSPAAASRMAGALDDLRPDVVAVGGWGYPEMRAALRWCRRHGVPPVILSETQADDAERQWWKEWLKARLYLRPCGAALVGGHRHAEYLKLLGFPADRIFLGYDIVDNVYFARGAERARRNPAAARARTAGIPMRPYFLASSRFVSRKNIPALVRAYVVYRETVGREAAWDLVVCGSGPEEDAVRARAAEAGLDAHVHLPGFAPYETLGDWYGLAATFVHPARIEAWGLVVNEACAAGLPILCSVPTGARYELVREGENGFLFDPASVDDIAAALVRMHRLRPDQRDAMGRVSERIVSRFGPDRFARGLIDAVRMATGRSVPS